MSGSVQFNPDNADFYTGVEKPEEKKLDTKLIEEEIEKRMRSPEYQRWVDACIRYGVDGEW